MKIGKSCLVLHGLRRVISRIVAVFMRIIALSLLLCAAMASVAIADERVPTASYNEQDTERLADCGNYVHAVDCLTGLSILVFESCRLQISLTPDFSREKQSQCAELNRPRLDAAYKLALKSVGDKESATNAVKDFYAEWMTTVEQMFQRINYEEGKAEYNKRLDDTLATLQNKANRLKLEK